MAYQSTYVVKPFLFTQGGVPINITGWVFRAQFRLTTDSADPALLELTTANGGFAVTDGPGGRLEMRITSTQMNTLPAGTIHFDVMRTDATPGPIRQFGGKMKVRKPVTR